jgi:hypothetical protein
MESHLTHLYKTCTSCNIAKSIDEFHRQKYGKFGRNSQCKCCVLTRINHKKNNRLRSNIFVEDINNRSVEDINKNSHQINNNEIRITNKECDKCNKVKNEDEFYENPANSTGYMSTCRECYITRDQHDEMTLELYCKRILQQFRRKYSRKTFHVNEQQLMFLFQKQSGNCFITNHPMSLEKDSRGNIDSIWNMTMFFKNKDTKIINLNDVVLVCHLVRTMENKYRFSIDKMKDIYDELTNN